MKKLSISIIVGLLCSLSHAQKYKSDSSNIRFYSDAPIEDIEAVNTTATSIIDLGSMAFVFVIPISSFEFKKGLMQEHFNENYLESDKYPNAIFKGKIKNWSGEKGEDNAIAVGELSLHGVEKQISIEGKVNYAEDRITISSVFPIELRDYKIRIPKAVFYNIAEVVEVTIVFQYQPYEKN